MLAMSSDVKQVLAFGLDAALALGLGLVGLSRRWFELALLGLFCSSW